MGTVYCPNFDQPICKTAMAETPPRDKRIVLCVCSLDLDNLLSKMDEKIAELEAMEKTTGGGIYG